MIPAKIKTEHESHKNINSQSSMVPIEAGWRYGNDFFGGFIGILTYDQTSL